MHTENHSVGGGEKSTITAWTLIVRAQGNGPEASAALGELLQQFRRFIVWNMVRLGVPPDQNTDDLFQKYATQFIGRQAIRVLRKDGSFRGWLRKSVEYFVSHEHRHWRRRMPERPRPCEAFGPYTEANIDAAYVATLVMQALELARTRSSNPERFTALQRFLPGPQSDFAPHGPLAAELGMSLVALGTAIHEERRRYRCCFDEVVMSTLDFGGDNLDAAQVEARLAAEKLLLLSFLDPPTSDVSFEFESELV